MHYFQNRLKSLVTCFFIVLLVIDGICQNNDSINYKPSSYISADAGIGIPLGQFGSSKSIPFNDEFVYGFALGNGYEGFAQTGFASDVCFDIHPNHSPNGFIIDVNYTENGFDMNSYMNNAKTSNNGSGQFAPSCFSNYTSINFMAGYSLIIQLKKISVEANILIGAFWGSIPDITYTGSGTYSALHTLPSEYYSGTWNASASTTTTTIGADLGINVSYRIAPKLNALIRFNYLVSGHAYSETLTIINNGSTEYSYQDSFTQNYTVINITGGIAYSISK
jgi:hypothetical protein